MISLNFAVFLLLLVAAVVPEFVPGVSSSSVPSGEDSSSTVSRQVNIGPAICTSRCYNRPPPARQECVLGRQLGLNCQLGRCPLRRRTNPGFVCRFISGTPTGVTVAAPTVAVPTVACPNRCFAPANSAPGTIQAALASAQADCATAPAPCAVRGCAASPINGFSCGLPVTCPNRCQASPALAAQDCATAPGCTTVPCALRGGAAGTACVPPPPPGAITAAAATPSASPSSSIGASPSPTPSVTPSPAATSSTSPSATPTPSTTVSPSPSPACSLIAGTVGTTAVTGVCRCGTDTATVSIPGSVDDAGMALSVMNEMTGGTAYTTCLESKLPAECNPDGFRSFSTAARTAAENCCSGSVVDGMGLNPATNQCRIGDGCQPVMVPDATTFITTQMATCTCTSMAAQAVQLRRYRNNAGAALELNEAGLAPVLNAYRTCLVNGLTPLCSSTGVATFSAAATAVVDACCTANAGTGEALGGADTDCEFAA